MDKLREETEQADFDKKKQLLKDQNAGYGYGGKFGVEKDRMDKSAVGHDYQGKVVKHASQKDYSDGFGGKFGVQEDRKDKSAVGWDHIEKVEKHASQKDYATGFGGKFGVQSDRVDKSAVGWDHIEKVEKHESQKGKNLSRILHYSNEVRFFTNNAVKGKTINLLIPVTTSNIYIYRLKTYALIKVGSIVVPRITR